MTTGAKLAAALMAGGRSTRMGRDKAGLVDAGGRELWRRQLELLRELRPEELLISCREDQSFPTDCGARLVFDFWREAGPMGGIVSALEAMEAEQLLVLAVDLPAMTRQVLTALLEKAGTGGAVFRCGEFLEPLVAVYPRSMTESGRRRLLAGEFGLHGWIGEAGTAMRELEAPAAWAGFFMNANDPAAWAKWLAATERTMKSTNGLQKPR